MDSQTALTLIPSAIAIVIAVVVPWMTFRLALRQDQIRRAYDKRADLYVDILTEAIAEQKYFELDIADDDTRKRMAVYYTDLRLPPLEPRDSEPGQTPSPPPQSTGCSTECWVRL